MSDAAGTNSELQSLQRSTVLRVYNYYRVVISLLFLFLFFDANFREVVGTSNPELFHTTILIYLSVNFFIALSSAFISEDIISKATPSFIILILDIIGLSLLMSASGGVSSGLGNFLIFTVAFGGGLIYGKASTVLPAFAFILTLYTEFFLFFLNQNETQSFFQAGILGIVYFVANIFFQKLSQQLRERDSEVLSLEQINQLIVEQMRTGVVLTSPTGEIKMINAAAKQLMNLKQQKARSLPAALHERATSTKAINANVATSFSVDGGSQTLFAHFSTIDNNSNERLIFIEDTSEAHRQAQQLKLASIGRLSASIAHEIRNPLGAISHAAQLLAESGDLNSGDKRLSDIIQDHCLRMNNVIENVLQMSRRRDATPLPIELTKHLEQFLTDFNAGQNSAANIELISDNKVKGATVSFDPHHLSQVLGNLCQNGLRYSEKNIGERKVILKYGCGKLSDEAYIEIIDFGTGVEQTSIASLFEPFFTTETSGTGLGLYISKELCEANHAQLQYLKAESHGSCFRITFQSDKN